VPEDGAKLTFDLFVDTESTDKLFLERSADGGATWTPVPFDVTDRGVVTRTDGSVSYSGNRRWVKASAYLAGGGQQLRWRYTTDADWSGRGVYVDGIRVKSGRHDLLDAERHPQVLQAAGWRLARR
jgi:hypothetical protein